ncbi:hypothetical protein BLA29_011001 [Euroglyphus maynei]|uniref:Protein kinase domain-containing protein n=1 Tax=Euroglyphus maynei TaxID=6958 RepID=A0A1Y3BCW1_EURMA|nr:hypothetical protein BLA29_011001 [Euroglyphus maynei]
MSDDNKRSSSHRRLRSCSKSNARKSLKNENRYSNLSRQIRAIRKHSTKSPIKQSIDDAKHTPQQSTKFTSFSDDSFKTAKTATNPKPMIIEIDSKTQAVLDRKNYRLLDKLSQGSFGEVYKGELKTDHRLNDMLHEN